MEQQDIGPGAEQAPGRTQQGREGGGLERLNAYAYLGVPDRSDYLAVMRVFCGTLLADLAAPDVAAELPADVAAESDDPLRTVTDRLEQLVRWGNLLRSSHTVKATSIADYQRSRSRYQLSKLGERIQRDADEVLAAADAAREVSTELLALVERGLAELVVAVGAPGGADAAEALDRVSTLFVQFAEFAESIRDFYAYLGQVLARYDLDGAEYQGFKELLLDYAEAISEDVLFRSPRIRAHLAELWPALPVLLQRIDDSAKGLSGLAEAAPGTRVQRSRGRVLADWEGLRDWFEDREGTVSQVGQLRDATMRAIQSLLANAKRMMRSSTGEISRRRDLLRLAKWFDEADTEGAHDLFTAAFGLYGARHLGVAPDPDAAVPAYVSWWHGPTAHVPVALRERGSRTPRGRAAGVEDHSAQKRLLLDQAELEDVARQDAAAELRSAAARFAEVRLSAAATSLLLQLLATALGNGGLRHDEDGTGYGLYGAGAALADLDLSLQVVRRPGARTVLRGVEGDLQMDDLELRLGPYSDQLSDQDGPQAGELAALTELLSPQSAERA